MNTTSTHGTPSHQPTQPTQSPRTLIDRHVRGHTLKDHHHWVEVFLHDGSDVTDTDLLAFRADLHAVENWESKPVLIHMGALVGVSIEGRKRIGRYTHPTPVAVVGEKPMDKVMANFILRSPTQARHFPTRAHALQWLGLNQPTPENPAPLTTETSRI